MIDIELIRQDLDMVKSNLAKRGVVGEQVDKLNQLDEKWRALTVEAENLQAEQNKASANPKAQDREALKKLSGKIKEVRKVLKQVDEERETAWRVLPNMVADDVPVGGEEDFEVIKKVPEMVPEKDFEVKSYFDLAEGSLFDLEQAAKVSGSRFVYIKGSLARLQVALVSWLYDKLSRNGFVPVIPPVLVGEKAMAGMGYLDHDGDEVYRTQDDLYLVGTSEQVIGPMLMGETLKAEKLPMRFVGYSSCFRREAGSHGKDVRGLLRVHQFDKVEMFSFTNPDKSEGEHEFILARQEEIIQELELPYRVVKLAAGDLGAPSAKTYDIETWIPSEKKYRETHSTSNTTDYQARRLNISIKEKGKKQKVHMLNGTALAMGRTFIALIENHQQEDGSIAIPKVLHDYLPFSKIEKTASK